MNAFIGWLLHNWVEVFASISGLIYIYFSLKQSIWLWPVGFVSSLAFIIVYFDARLFADMSLQVYYCVTSIYGWFFWIYGKKHSSSIKEEKKLPISRLTPLQWIIVIIVTLTLTAAYYPFGNIFHASFPLLDGFVTAGSIIATWLLARKIIDQWIIWIFVDGISTVMLVFKGKYIASVLMLIYTVLAIVGYYKWLKEYYLQNNGL
jgi:nicotinamide mononucleotide transporter